MIRFIIAVFILTSANLSAQATRSKSSETKFPDAKTYAKKIYSYKIINTLNHTYCYDIYADGKRMIHQPSMPSMPGNEGFKTKTAAIKVAKLVISKIKKGEMPPSVSPEELRKLKAI